MMNRVALFHVGCTSRVVALPASISFVVKGKTTILAEKTHPKTKFQIPVCCSKKFSRLSVKTEGFGWFCHLKTTQQENVQQTGTSLRLLQNNISGETLEVFSRSNKRFQ